MPIFVNLYVFPSRLSVKEPSGGRISFVLEDDSGVEESEDCVTLAESDEDESSLLLLDEVETLSEDDRGLTPEEDCS